MPELSALRARLKDRQVKEGALGTVESTVCLDLSLLGELEALQHEKAIITATASGVQSLSGGQIDTSEIDGLIDAKQDEIKAASIVLVFKALSSARYQEILNPFADPDDEDQPAWMDALAAASYWQCWSEGEKVDVPWEEIKAATAFGELAEIREKVYVLNRRKQDVPFLSRPSRTPRLSDAKSKPASR